MERERQDRPPRVDLWTPEGLQAAYEWFMTEDLHNEGGVGFEPLTDAELEAVLKKIKSRNPSPLPPDIERLEEGDRPS